MKKETSDFYFRLKKDEKVVFLEKSLSFFRDEAFKLAENFKKLKLSH